VRLGRSPSGMPWDSHRDEVAAYVRLGADGKAQQPLHFAEGVLGDRVRIMGLEAKPELNGRTGKALHIDRAKGRMAVDLGGKDGTVLVRLRNVEGIWLPLRLAEAVTTTRDIPTVRLWLCAGGDVNAWGAAFGNSDMVALLVESLADPTLKDSSGRKAADYAEPQSSIVELLGSPSIEDSLRSLEVSQRDDGPQRVKEGPSSSEARPVSLSIPPRQLVPVYKSTSTCYSNPHWKMTLNDGCDARGSRGYQPNDLVHVDPLSFQSADQAMSSPMFECVDGERRPFLLFCVVFKPPGLPASAPDDLWLLKSLNHRSQVVTTIASESQMKLLCPCPSGPVQDACLEWGIGSSSNCFADKTNGSRPAFALTLGPGSKMRNFERAETWFIGDLAVRSVLDGTCGLPPSPSGFYLPCVPRNVMLGALPTCHCEDHHCCLILLALLEHGLSDSWPPQAAEIFPGARGDPATTSHNMQWVCIEHIDAAFAGEKQRLADKEANGHTAVASPLKPCAVCGGGGLKACALCKKVWYCSIECQRKHWKAWHKVECLRDA